MASEASRLGNPNVSERLKKAFVVIILFLAGTGVSFANGYTFPMTRGLECGQAHWLRDGSLLYIVGIITNDSGAPFASIQVNINVYDKDNAVIGSTMTMVANLGPGEIWKWKAMVYEDEAWGFRITGIYGDR